jgi:glycosyltransferase involved in cell wall biosynthesis
MMMIISSLLYLPIFFKFGIHSQVVDAKPLLKEALQAEVGLPVDRNIPVIGFIGRLEEQKGSDILVAAIPHFIRENVQIIVLVSIRIGFRRKKKKVSGLEFVLLTYTKNRSVLYCELLLGIYSFRGLARNRWRSSLNSWR